MVNCECFLRILFIVRGERADERAIARRVKRMRSKMNNHCEGYGEFSSQDIKDTIYCIEIANEAFQAQRKGRRLRLEALEHKCKDFTFATYIATQIFTGLNRLYTRKLDLLKQHLSAESTVMSPPPPTPPRILERVHKERQEQQAQLSPPEELDNSDPQNSQYQYMELSPIQAKNSPIAIKTKNPQTETIIDEALNDALGQTYPVHVTSPDKEHSFQPPNIPVLSFRDNYEQARPLNEFYYFGRGMSSTARLAQFQESNDSSRTLTTPPFILTSEPMYFGTYQRDLQATHSDASSSPISSSTPKKD